jgi:hypothetical protein
MRHAQFPSRTVAVSSFSSRLLRENGVTLAETLIAAAILVTGLLGIAQLMASSVQIHQLARNSEEASRLVTAKLEQLSKLDFATSAAVQITPSSPDSLSTNVANYFDSPTTGFTRRWRVQAGPIANTRLVTVRMLPLSRDLRLTKPLDVTSIIRRW